MKNNYHRLIQGYVILAIILSCVHCKGQDQDDEIPVYKKIEPIAYLGIGQMYNQVNNYLVIERPSFELRISYPIQLNQHFLMTPFIGYAKITGNFKDNYSSISSLEAGSDIFYKIKNWKLGAELNAKKINNYSLLSNESNDLNITPYLLDKYFYQAGINISYSINNFSLKMLCLWTVTPVTFVFFDQQRFNEYLIGIGYHL